MTVVERVSANPRSLSVARATAQSRDSVVDAMRGIAILMVIGIHSLPQPLDAAWAKSLDAALRPCVPVFLFVSGYLTALSGRVPLAKRLKAALIPYAIAFAAAYAYMALHNPAMDHRIGTAFARFALGYVFVYYYVFVYVCCTLALWLVFAIGGTGPDSRQTARGAADPLDRLRIVCRRLSRPRHVQARRFGRIARRSSHARHSVLVLLCRARRADRDVCRPERPEHAPRSCLLPCWRPTSVYAVVRILGLGDAATYDSIAFFLYAALFCAALFAIQPRSPLLGWFGSGSYFIYLWHIFIVMALRDHTALRQLGDVTSFAVCSGVTALVTTAALLALRQFASPRLCRWLGA